MRYYSGSGLLNTAINKLPFELHLPSYNFCGPGTKLEKRLARGDRGVNGLDEACREHDIAYSREKDLKRRHDADRILRDKALERYFSRNARVDEKLAALGVAGAMQAKVKFGMAYNSSPNSKVTNMCLKSVEKLKKTTEKSLLNIETCLNKMRQFNNLNSAGKAKKRVRKTRKVKNIKNRNMVDELEEEEPKVTLIEKKFDPKDVNKVTLKNVTVSAPSRKRKLIDDKAKPTKKDPKVTLSAPLPSRKRKLIDDTTKPTKFTLIEKKFDSKDVNKVALKNVTVSAPSRKRKLADVDDDDEPIPDTQTCRNNKLDDDDEASFSVKRSKLF